jgi:hypothetical protein
MTVAQWKSEANKWRAESERRAKGYWTAWQRFPIVMGIGHLAAGVVGWVIRAIIDAAT